MGSVTCSQCGFVSFATSEVCKQCGNALPAAHPGAPFAPAQAAAFPYPQAGFAGGQSKGMAALALVCGLAGLPALIFVVSVGVMLGGSWLACTLVGLAAFGVASLLALVLGIAATVRANRRPSEFGGKGLAVAGIVLGALSLVSVVPVGVIGAIAVPNLLAARRAANEGAAVGSLRRIVEAQAAYQESVGEGGFGTLEDLRVANLIDAQLARGVKNGYRFEIEVGEDSFGVTASPLEYPNSGTRSFYTSEIGVIRAADKRGLPADVDDPALADSSAPHGLPADDAEEIVDVYAPRAVGEGTPRRAGRR